MVINHPQKASELLFPLPQTVEDLPGTFRFHTGLCIATAPLFQSVGLFACEVLGCKAGGEDILFKENRELQGEAYEMKISKQQVVIKSGTTEGAFRGLSTLRRLILSAQNQIPCCRIQDYPLYEWRGLMIDCSRHYFTPAFLKKLIDIASLFHLNRFHWHLTDDQGWRIPIDGWEKLTSTGSKRTLLQHTDNRSYGQAYSRQEIQDIQAYAHMRHMMVIPEIETPGHASAALASYPQLGCTGGPYETQDRWGIFEDVLCSGNDEVLTFLGDVIAQVASLFTDPYIHIGGDECPHTRWETCPKCQKRIQDQGLGDAKELQSWMTSKICAMVHDAGKRPIGWDEVLEGTQTMGLPQDLIVMSWRGVAGGIEATKRGHQVIMCPKTEGCYFDYKHTDDPEEFGNLGISRISEVANFSPLKDIHDEVAKPYILGSQGNLWTEKITCGSQAEYMLFPRLMVLAERLWNPQESDQTLQRIEILHTLCDALSLNCYKGPLS